MYENVHLCENIFTNRRERFKRFLDVYFLSCCVLYVSFFKYIVNHVSITINTVNDNMKETMSRLESSVTWQQKLKGMALSIYLMFRNRKKNLIFRQDTEG